jgi:predicted dehydrogenase
VAAPEKPHLTIVGAGELTGSSYLPAAAALGWTMTLVDRDLDRARRLASRHRRVVVDVAASVGDVGLNPDAAVVIATPARTHAEVAFEAMDAGARRILLEKPPTTTREEYEGLRTVAEAAGATIRGSFLRRGWHPIKTGRAHFEEWSTRFGLLERASLTEGAPWGWKSIATRERGAAGLDEILLDELAHGFDCLFHITHSSPPRQKPALTVDASSVWEFRGSARGAFGAGEYSFEVRISRNQVLANAIVLDFEGATVTVELPPSGGICIRPRREPALLIEGPPTLDTVAEQFGGLLQGAFVAPGGGQTSPHLTEWEGPLGLIAGFRAVSDINGGPVEVTP